MTTLEIALSRCTGLETTAEELDALLTKEDIGLNDLTGIELFEEDYSELLINYECADRVSTFGHSAKYFC